MRASVAVLVLSTLYVLGNANNLAFPAGVNKCALNDDVCFRNAVEYVLRTYGSSGIKEFGLVKLDPLHIKKMRLGKNPNSPVSIDLSFEDVDLLGLQQAEIKHASGFSKNADRPVDLTLMAPRFILKGPYSIDGRVLILPIVGKGSAEFVLDHVNVRAKLKMRTVPKGDGQTFLEVLHFQLQLDPAHVSYKLGGLFNGQKELSENMHMLINENWKEIFNEIKGDISEALGLVFKSVLNNFFRKHPLEYLFSDA